MLTNKDLEIIGKIYGLKADCALANNGHIKTIKKIEEILFDYINDETVSVNVKILDRFMVVKYGYDILRRRDDDEYYKATSVSRRFLDIAGVTDDYSYAYNANLPLFKTEIKIIDHQMPIFDDLENGKVLNELMKVSNKNMLESININDYLNVDNHKEFARIDSVVQIIAKIIDDLIYIEHHEHNERMKKVAEYHIATRSTSDFYDGTNDASLIKKFKEGSLNAMLSDSPNQISPNLDLIPITPWLGTYAENTESHIKNEISHYLRILFQDSLASSSFNYVFRRNYSLDSLKCIKQFLRLCHLVNSKAEYMFESVESMPIGAIYADGKFEELEQIKTILINILANKSIDENDVDFIIDLYSDKSRVIGMLLPENEKRHKAKEIIRLIDDESIVDKKSISDFA